MRLLTYLFILVSAIILTSCLTIEEKITLNKDGSGTFRTFVDMGEMLSNPMMAQGIKKAMDEDGGTKSMQVDSIIDLYTDLAAQNPQWTDADRSIMRRVESRMQMDMEKGEGGVYVNFAFANLDELKKMQTLMSASKENAKDTQNGEAAAAGLMGGGPLSGVENEFKWKKGSFSRMVTSSGDITDMLNMGGENTGTEMMDAMKMMMGDAQVIYIVEFPGKVKKVKGFPGHSVEKNQLIQTFDFLEVLEDPSLIDEGLDGSVKFKKK